jgi:hypothetical protein
VGQSHFHEEYLNINSKMLFKKSSKYTLASLPFIALISVNASAVNCTTNSTSISTNCTYLEITDPNLTITVNSGVTVSAPGGTGVAFWNKPSATNTTIVNNGIITSTSESIYNPGTITSLINTGTISANIHFYNNSTIGVLTNTGAITGGARSIYSLGTIGVLNNLQGASSSALTLTNGNLPTQYNIIVQSISNYGQLSAAGSSGPMAFNIYGNLGTTLVSGVGASALTANRYRNVLQGFSSLAGVSGTTGTYGGYSYSLVTNGVLANSWDLLVYLAGPALADTQASIKASARKLRGIFNAATVSSNFSNMNTYDCNLFDARGICISAGGNYTAVENPNSNTTSAVVVVGYKATPNIRIGGFLDQNISSNLPSGIKVSNKIPLMGVFAVWNENADSSGMQVKVANAYQDKGITTTRDVIGSSEAGVGSTNLNTQSYVGEISYAYIYRDKTLLRPYFALRQTTIKQDAYTETGVTTPLTYAALYDRSTTALLGLKLNHALTPKTTLTASFGIEHDLEHSIDQYSATSSSIANLTSENFNDSITRTRPIASAGAYYAVSKTQRISFDVYCQQMRFQSTGSTTAYFNYMVGF